MSFSALTFPTLKVRNGKTAEVMVAIENKYGPAVGAKILSSNTLEKFKSWRLKMFDIRNISYACLKYQVDDVVLLTDPWIVDEPIKSNVIYNFSPARINLGSL